MSDAINPQHYKAHGSGVEAIEICEHMDFCLGNAIKYLWRVDHKGSSVEDLQKSAWYLSRAIGKDHRLNIGPREHIPLFKVIANEPPGSVLRSVLELTVQRMLGRDRARVADALMRVTQEIEEVFRA